MIVSCKGKRSRLSGLVSKHLALRLTRQSYTDEVISFINVRPLTRRWILHFNSEPQT